MSFYYLDTLFLEQLILEHTGETFLSCSLSNAQGFGNNNDSS